MSNVIAFQTAREIDEARIRQETVEDTHRQLHNVTDGLRLFPHRLRACLEEEVWKHDRVVSQTVIEPVSFYDFITKSYPIGLDATYDLVERFLGSDVKLLALWERHSRREIGGQAGNANAAKPETNVDNVHVRSGAPPARRTGNTASAGMRRLQTAAETDPKAKAEYDAVLAGEQTVHAACIAMGWRRKTVTLPDEPGAILDALLKRMPPAEVGNRLVASVPPADRPHLLSAILTAGWKPRPRRKRLVNEGQFEFWETVGGAVDEGGADD